MNTFRQPFSLVLMAGFYIIRHTLPIIQQNCYSGFAFNIVFDFPSVAVTLPSQIIFGVTYNTQNWGYSPIGIPGPYNSLNVGYRNYNQFGPMPAGIDVNTGALFLNSTKVATSTKVLGQTTSSDWTLVGVPILVASVSQHLQRYAAAVLQQLQELVPSMKQKHLTTMSAAKCSLQTSWSFHRLIWL